MNVAPLGTASERVYPRGDAYRIPEHVDEQGEAVEPEGDADSFIARIRFTPLRSFCLPR